MQRDFYQILGVERGASAAEIRAAFTRLAKRHHPDMAGRTGDLPGRLHEVQQAYRCLSDEEARAAHDRALDDHARHHLARQHAVQRRLRHYDRRHPRRLPRGYGGIPWRSLMIAGVGVAIVARISLTLIG